MSPADLSDRFDVDLCRRVTAAGRHPEASAQQIKAGRLTIPPHPEWTLPLPEEIDWRADPFKDKNWRFQFNMLRWLDPLRSSAERGNAKSLRLWAAYARNWVESNRPDSSRRAPDSWHNMQDGLRAIHLLAAVPVVAANAPHDLEWLHSTLVDHGDWLMSERNPGHSNHALHQHQGLVALGAGLKRADWVSTAAERLRVLFDESWDRQGVNSEGAIAYHSANVLWWRRAARRFAVAGVDVDYIADGLKDSEIELAHATRPDGTFVTIGDTDPQVPKKLTHPAMKWVMSSGAEGTPPEETIVKYDAGYVFGRSGWGEHDRDFSEETFFSFTFGEHKVHGHEDGGSFTFSSRGTNWISDPGKYSYTHRDRIRKHLIHHDTHSLVFLRGESRTPNSSVRLTDSSMNDEFCSFTFADDGYRRAKIQRKALYSRSGEYVVFIDLIRSPRDFTAVQRWQLGAGVKASIEGRVARLAKGESHAVIAGFGNSPVPTLESPDAASGRGHVSAGWKKLAAAPAVEYEASSRLHRFITVVAASAGRPPEVERVPGLPSNTLAFRIRTDRAAETVVWNAEGAHALSYDAEFDAIAAHVPKSSSDVQRREPLSPLSPEVRAKAHRLREAVAKSIWNRENPTGGKVLAERIHETAARLQPADLGLLARRKDLLQILGAEAAHPKIRPALVPHGDAPRSATIRGRKVVAHHGNPSPNLIAGETAIHAVDLNDLVLPSLYIPGEEKALTVIFHGAIDRSKITLPMFQRFRGQTELNFGHTLFVADPTLDLSSRMGLGWYLGTENIDLPLHIARLIETFCEKLEIADVYLHGNSGGGFAALQVGAFLPHSMVSVDEPQTDTREYLAPAQRVCYEAAFGSRTAPTDPSVTQRLSVSERYLRVGAPKLIRYFHNTGDSSHYERHAAPFTEFLRAHPNLGTQLDYFEEYLGQGHRAAPTEIYQARMRSLYAAGDSSGQ